MERVNVFLGDDKKFKKACPIYQKILQEHSSNPSLSDEDRELLFSGIRRVLLSVEVVLCSSNWDSLSSLFTYLLSNQSLWTSFHVTWLKRWKALLTIVKTIDSDDSFQIATLHKTLDSLIVLWDKKKESEVEEKERVLVGNLQLYVLEILMRLLSRAVLEYQLSPVLKSCSLLVNECDYVFEGNREMYELFYKQYKMKKNKTSEHKIVRHFTEEDSRNRIHPMRLKGANPYLL